MRTNKKAVWIVGAVASLLIAIIAVNWVRVTLPVKEGLQGRDDIAAIGYYHWAVAPGTIVYDLREVGPSASSASVIGAFFGFADEMKDRKFNEVLLAWRGDVRFRLSGDDFQMIGAEFAWQNPVFMLRTFPEKLKTPEGRPAFETWSGGMLGVLNQQMDDVNGFTEQWFMRDALKELLK